MKRIQTLQNQLLKVLSHRNYLFSTDKLHDEFELLKIKDLTKQEIATFVHNYFSNSLPPVFDGYFETLASTHNRNTRNGETLLKIHGHSSFSAPSIKIQGAKVWNNMNNNLKNILKVKTFRKKFETSCFYYERNRTT